MIAVIYRMKVKQGFEQEFEENWALMTQEFFENHGGQGSCLHYNVADGYYLAYARWPSLDLFRKKKEISNQLAFSKMNECISERLPPMILDVKNDMLKNHSTR